MLLILLVLRNLCYLVFLPILKFYIKIFFLYLNFLNVGKTEKLHNVFIQVFTDFLVMYIYFT